MIKGMYQQYKRLGYTRIWELAHMFFILIMISCMMGKLMAMGLQRIVG